MGEGDKGGVEEGGGVEEAAGKLRLGVSPVGVVEPVGSWFGKVKEEGVTVGEVEPLIGVGNEEVVGTL